jgi:hypothetical protein
MERGIQSAIGGDAITIRNKVLHGSWQIAIHFKDFSFTHTYILPLRLAQPACKICRFLNCSRL